MRRCIASTSVPSDAATSEISYSLCGRNSWSGGSSRRIVTGKPAMISNRSRKSLRWKGNSRASAARRPCSVSAMIICRTAPIRSGSKNMCSVRQSPMPSAPKRLAVSASNGVSALARTRKRRTLSAQPINVEKSPESCGSTMGTEPMKTSPVAPSSVRIWPASMRTPPALRYWLL